MKKPKKRCNQKLKAGHFGAACRMNLIYCYSTDYTRMHCFLHHLLEGVLFITDSMDNGFSALILESHNGGLGHKADTQNVAQAGRNNLHFNWEQK